MKNSARARRSIIVEDKGRKYYDASWKESEKNPYRSYWKQRLDSKIISLLRRIGDKQRVLEIGVGKGDLATRLVSENKIYMYVGVDITEVGVRIADRKIKSGFQFLVSDGTYLPFRPNMFDIIICSETIEHITQKEKLMSEMRMVLRTKGFLILTTPNPDRQLFDIVPNILCKIPRLNFRSKQVVESPLDRHELADLLEDGKFKIIFHGGLIFQSVLFIYLEGLFRRRYTPIRWISEHLEEKNLLPSLSFYQVVLARCLKLARKKS